MPNLIGQTTDLGVAGVLGESSTFNGVLGITTANGHAGVAGVCDTSNGNGVYGRSKQANGVLGFSGSNGHAGVAGANDDGDGNGVYGRSAKNDGVIGITKGDGRAGVAGVCDEGNGNGIYGRSKAGSGVVGFSSSKDHAAVAGANDNSEGVGIYGKGGRLAGLFEGTIEVTGDIRLPNADCAEDFDVSNAASVEPGTVMVLGDGGPLVESSVPYDKRVAGVISGAGEYRPGIILDKQDAQRDRRPIALLGKVFCKVDASYGSIEVGDLLTTSASPGCAMKAQDSARAFGAVIGKALRPFNGGRGLIPVLIALQ